MSGTSETPHCAGRVAVAHRRTAMRRSEVGWICPICWEVVECFAGDGPILPSDPFELGFAEDDGSRAVWHKSCFDAAVKENW